MLQADFKCTVSLDSVHIVDKLGIINETVVDRHTEFIVDGWRRIEMHSFGGGVQMGNKITKRQGERDK